jgi:phospholipid/cholesterol/gamma-HCH transport system permease protein
MGELAVRSVRIAFTPPFSWVRNAVVEMSVSFRRCLIPLIICHSVYLIGYGIILFGVVLTNLGVVERESGAMWLIWVREIGTWITAMIFAGVVGSAATADLGARKIREELDALDVLGIDKLRLLVVPRVVAMTIASPVMAIVSLYLVVGVNYILGPLTLGYSHGVYRDNLVHTILPIDVYAMLLKNAVIGFFVGVVSCHKGLSCKGGAEGVGRAVNQAVVISFFGIWLFNSLFNLGYLTLFPDAATLRG